MRILPVLLLAIHFLLLSGCKSIVIRKDDAAAQVIALKDGYLLVRLQTSERTAEALAARGEAERAEAVRLRQETQNKKLAYAFAQHFDFCPVFFFYGEDSEAVRQGDFSGNLYHADFSPVDTARSDRFFLFAELANVYHDPLVVDDEEGRRPAGGTGGMESLVVKDRNFVQLDKPFPFEVDARLAGESREENIIEILNRRLYDYYGTALKRQIRRRMR